MNRTPGRLVGQVVSLSLAGFITLDGSAQTFTDQAGTVLGGANFNSRSASLGDYDNDGDLDVFFQGAFGAQQFFENNTIGSGNGTLSFTNVSGSALPSGLGSSWSAAWGDYNGDGDVDIFVGQSNINASGDVLRNDGPSGFSNPSVSVGLNDPGFHQNVAWNDIDGDLDLDLIIAMEGPERHEIYLQQDDGTFDPVGAAAGFQVDFGTKAYGMAIGDTDGDGDLDIYISTCRPGGDIRNNFFENQLADTGTLSFVDIADTNGTQFLDNSYGAEFHDFDDDGDLDLFMVGADGQESKLWRNDGGNQFTDTDTIRGSALLIDVGGDLNGGRAVDYDNDGDLDLFFHDHKPLNGADVARKLYRNDGGWTFTDVTVAEGLSATNEGSYDSAWGDIDLDGDQDLIATTDSGSNERVFISDASTNGNHWLYVELDGTSDNTTAIGATIYATIDEGTAQERTLRREANTNAGTFNQSDLPVHFGLGDATVIDTLRIVWPDGNIQQLVDVSVDQYLSIGYVAAILGDLDFDGDVDGNDFGIFAAQFGMSEPPDLLADLNDDGVVDGNDFGIFAGNFGLGTGASVVPEPGALALLGPVALMGWRRRRAG